MSAKKCQWCAGGGYEPFGEEVITCVPCGGSGYETGVTDLGPTRSCPKGRPATYNPGTRVLTVRRGKKDSDYLVSEIVPDLTPEDRPFRVFEFLKAGGEAHHCRVGDGWQDCDCRGKVSNSSARAAAYDRYLPVSEQDWTRYDTAGCVHLDAVLWVLQGGLWDAELPIGFETPNQE
jgi:hypothetical protein